MSKRETLLKEKMEEILKYFPDLAPEAVEKLSQLPGLYGDWNSKINVVSRKDIDNLMTHHVLHSLAIAKFLTPVPGTQIIDLGTGGGFPGIPLAIVWPQCRFHLIDRIGKKLTVAKAVADDLGLQNVTFQHGDAGECKLKADYVVSRAVMPLADLCKAAVRMIAHRKANRLPDGLLCLKGGDLGSELAQVRRPMIEVPLSDYFAEDYFKEKELIYVEM